MLLISQAWNIKTMQYFNNDGVYSPSSSLIDSAPFKIYSLLLHPSKLLLASTSSGEIKIYNTLTKKFMASMKGHCKGVNSIKLAGDNIVSCSSDKSIKIWDLKTQSCIQTIPNLTGEVLDVAISGKLLMGSTYDSKILAFDINDGLQTGLLEGHRWETYIKKLNLDGTSKLLTNGCLVDRMITQSDDGISGHSRLIWNYSRIAVNINSG